MSLTIPEVPELMVSLAVNVKDDPLHMVVSLLMIPTLSQKLLQVFTVTVTLSKKLLLPSLIVQ